jgi:predicted ester cyclase
MKRWTLTLLCLAAVVVAETRIPAAARSHRHGSTEANKALARRVFDEVWNQGNMAAADEIFAPTVVNHGPGAAPAQTGLEAFKQGVTNLRTTFPDLHFTVEDQIAEGDKVATRFTMHGTQKGELRMGPTGAFSATGKEVTINGIVITRIQDGKIAEGWVNVDQLGALTQLGLFPPPAPARVTAP